MHKFAKRIKSIGGTAYIVGGYVRDKLRGKKSKDADFVITGVTEDKLLSIYPKAEKVGKSFPVYLVCINGTRCEVAFARTERKAGTGYNGFDVKFDPSITIEQDLFRRDTTMNSMAIEILTGKLIDPYDGRESIRTNVIKATSYHFKDDPVRSLRAARQAAQFDYSIDPETIQLMDQCKNELLTEPRERFVGELHKALQCDTPSLFFRRLKDANLLNVTYPQIAALIGQTQPLQYHPEGDAFEHSMLIVDEVAKLTTRIEVRFAALVHDLGKGLTPKAELPKHHGHDQTGLLALSEFNSFMTLPKLWLKCACFAIEQHMRANDINRPGKIVELLTKLSKSPIGADGFAAILKADAGKIPWYIKNYRGIIREIKSVNGKQAPEHLKGREIGNWISQEQIRKYRSYMHHNKRRT